MKFSDLGDKGPNFIREMDSQGYRGSRDSVEDDADKKEYSGKVAKPGDVVKQGADALDNAFNHAEDDWSKDFERRMKKGVAEGSLEEIDRRGFLKGMGAAAVAGAAGGAKANLSDREYQFLVHAVAIIYICNNNNLNIEIDKSQCDSVKNSLKMFAKKSGISSKELNDLYAQQSSEYIRNKDSIHYLKMVSNPKNVETVIKALNQLRPFESVNQGVAEGSLKEFAPDNSGGDGREEDVLLKFARMWYNGDEATQQQVEKALARQGWEIGELESEEGGAFVVQSGDENGDTYIGFEANDLTEASLAQMRDYFNQADSDSVKVDRNYDAPSKKQNPLGVPPEIQALVNKMYHAGKISPQEFEVLRKFQQKTKINVGIREADKNPYAIGMSQAMKSTGDKPPLKKSTINKAHAIARAIKKGD
jgi:hypothetical protein